MFEFDELCSGIDISILDDPVMKSEESRRAPPEVEQSKDPTL